MGPFFDKLGKPISMDEWLTISKETNCFVEEMILNGVRISTIYRGVGCSDCIYETMVQDTNNEVEYVDSYPDRTSAEEGHARAVEWARENLLDKEEPV